MITYWDVLAVVNYSVCLVGIPVNIMYFKLVVLNQGFDGYCRTACFIINSGTISCLVSNVITTSTCLFVYGSYTDSGPCEKTLTVGFMRYIHSYGEFSIADGKLILVLEQFVSVFFPKFRSSTSYKMWFSGLIIAHLIGLNVYLWLIVKLRSIPTILACITLLSILVLSSLLLAIFLLCESKNRYYETVGKLSLNDRFRLSESYELCRSCLYPLLSSLALGAPYCASMWLLLFGIIFKDLFYEFFFFGNIVMNVNSTVFPLIFLYSSKKIRKKILRINPFRGKSAPIAFEVQNLDGERIDFIQSQNEYFQQLRTTWG